MAKGGKKESLSAEPVKKECQPETPYKPDINIQDLFTYYRAINDVLSDAFKTADRVNLETSWGKYMVFMTKRDDREFYFVHTGCTCNLKCMPKNMEYFPNLHEVLKFIVNGSVLALLKNEPKKECCTSKCVKNVCRSYQKPPHSILKSA